MSKARVEQSPSRCVRVFCSYAHEDGEHREALEKHLSSLLRGGDIELWHDREIVAGERWADQIDEHLDDAELIVLLVSADFLASRYCFEIEMGYALARHQAGSATVVPVIVRPVDWAAVPISFLQALPTDARAVAIWENEDAAWTNVVQGIRAAVADIRARRGEADSPGDSSDPATGDGPVPVSPSVFRAADQTMMRYVLLVTAGEQIGERFMLPEGASLLVGRDPRCQIRLSPKDRKASRRHARVAVKNDQLYVTDLESKNGTFVNGNRIERMEVERDEHISCGETVIRVEEAPPPDRTVTQVLTGKTHIVLRDDELESEEPSSVLLDTLLNGALGKLFGR